MQTIQRFRKSSSKWGATLLGASLMACGPQGLPYDPNTDWSVVDFDDPLVEGIPQLALPVTGMEKDCELVEANGSISEVKWPLGTTTEAVFSLRSLDSALLGNGEPCLKTNGQPITKNEIKKFTITGQNNVEETVILDFINGTWAEGTSDSTKSGIHVKTTDTDDEDYLSIRGSKGNDTYYLQKDGIHLDGAGPNKDVFFDPLSGTIDMASVKKIVFSMVSGSDRFYGRKNPSDNDASAALYTTGRLTVYGGSGSDFLYGSDGADTMYGGPDNDELVGYAGDDLLYGDEGDDEFMEGTGTNIDDGEDPNGADKFFGGEGNDTVDYTGRTAAVTVDLSGTSTDGRKLYQNTPTVTSLAGVDYDHTGTTLTVRAASHTYAVGDRFKLQSCDTESLAAVAVSSATNDADGNGTADDGSVTVTSAGWTVDAYAGMLVRVDQAGDGSYEEAQEIASNTADTIVLASGVTWTTVPTSSDKIQVVTNNPDDLNTVHKVTAITSSSFSATPTLTADENNISSCAMATTPIVVDYDDSAETLTVNTASVHDIQVGEKFTLDSCNSSSNLTNDDLNAEHTVASVATDKRSFTANYADASGTASTETFVPSCALFASPSEGDEVNGGSTDTDGNSIEAVKGGKGNDTLTGIAADEVLRGGPGDDVLKGNGGNDTIYGDEGDDTIDAGGDLITFDDPTAVVISGNVLTVTVTITNTLSAGDYVDISDCDLEDANGTHKVKGVTSTTAFTVDLTAADANATTPNACKVTYRDADVMQGGADTDVVTYSSRTANLTNVDIDNIADDGEAGEKDNVQTDIENIIGGSGDDTITGSSGNNEITGGGGNDILKGQGGSDTFYEGSSSGSTGNDDIDGGTGVDWVSYRDANGAVTVKLSTETADSGLTGSETDKIMFVENVEGASRQANTIEGDKEDNYLVGGSGNDTITGGKGDDYIDSGAGADFVDCGAGQGDIAIGAEAAPTTLALESTTITATDGTVTVSGAGWTTNAYQGMVIRLDQDADGSVDDERVIDSNTADVITILGTWTTDPDDSSTFDIVQIDGQTAAVTDATGTNGAGNTADVLKDTGAFTAGAFVGRVLWLVGADVYRVITANSANDITYEDGGDETASADPYAVLDAPVGCEL